MECPICASDILVAILSHIEKEHPEMTKEIMQEIRKEKEYGYLACGVSVLEHGPV